MPRDDQSEPRTLRLLDDARPLSTGDMARRCGSTLRTVRFYEQQGLIRPLGRAGGGRRQFAPGELERLELALDLREAGMSISDIRGLFELKSRYATPTDASDEVAAILGTEIERMQQKIAKLRRLREELVSVVSVLSECQECSEHADHKRFPEGCRKCDVMTQPNLPRAVKVLWSK